MIRFAALIGLSCLLGACSHKPQQPLVQPTNEVSLGFERVPRKPDVAAYPAHREHVFAVQPEGRNFVVVRVLNYPKPRPIPAPVFSQAPPIQAPDQQQTKSTHVAPTPIEFRVHFSSGSHSLDASAAQAIDQAIQSPSASSRSSVSIQGHTDSIGSDKANQSLSERRANAVKKYLISKGFQSSDIQSIGFGETSPIQTNESASGRKANRRADVHLNKKEP